MEFKKILSSQVGLNLAYSLVTIFYSNKDCIKKIWAYIYAMLIAKAFWLVEKMNSLSDFLQNLH